MIYLDYITYLRYTILVGNPRCRTWNRVASYFFSVPSIPSPNETAALLTLWLRRPSRERKIPGSNSACGGIFPGLSHTSDLKIGTPVATLPGTWHYRVSAGTGQPGVSIL